MILTFCFCLFLRILDLDGLYLGHRQPSQISLERLLSNQVQLIQEGRNKRPRPPNLPPRRRPLGRNAKHDGARHGSEQRIAPPRGGHGADGRAEGAPRARHHAQVGVAVVDADGARAAVAEDVGDARHEDDVALAAGDGAHEAGLLGEREGRRGVDAALGDGGAGDGLDLAFIALDDGEVTRGEKGFDGVATDGGCAGSGICVSLFSSIMSTMPSSLMRGTHPTGSNTTGPSASL